MRLYIVHFFGHRTGPFIIGNIPKPQPAEREQVRARMRELVALHPRFGYRRVAALLRQEDCRANPKRIHRLWVAQGYKVPRRVVRKCCVGGPEGGLTRLRAKAPNEVWAWDFFHDRLEDGRPVKWLACVDEFTRECVVPEIVRQAQAKGF